MYTGALRGRPKCCVRSSRVSAGSENQWTGNPLLEQWLTARKAGFSGLAAETGGGWDFSMESSLDRLEDLIHDRFSSSVEVAAAEDTALAQGTYWYLGKVFVRAHDLQ